MQQQLQPSPKKTFLTLRNEHHFDIMKLADRAMVHPEVVYKMLLNDPVPRDYAVMVLNVYNKENATQYSLNTVNVKISSF